MGEEGGGVRPILVVDAANVVGARADGWWRDRVGATARLRDELTRLAASGMTGIPPWGPSEVCFPEIVLVVEGAAARGLAAESDHAPASPDTPAAPGVRVVRAEGSGDDAIVEVVRAAEPGVVYVVVTADRELRSRCTAMGASILGPRALLDRLR